MADVCLYDLSDGLWGPSLEFEQVVEGFLVAAHVGGHAAGLGSSAGRGIDQHGLADPAEGVEEGFDGQVVAGAVGLQSQEVGQLQGQHAGEGVHGDVVLGPVVHRGERDFMGVFELPEAEFDF